MKVSFLDEKLNLKVCKELSFKFFVLVEYDNTFKEYLPSCDLVL